MIHINKSLRLKGYDYSQPGFYFITLCLKYRFHLLGEIENGKMILGKIGQIANDYWLEIPQHYPQVNLHEFVIMPDHLHGIIEIVRDPVGSYHGMTRLNQFGKPISGSISMILNQYKSSVKRWCNKNDYNYFEWQRLFHDSIIRTTDDFGRIELYIQNNPIKWRK